jgi:NitT/TauT family transport system substrate-binding protein
MNDKNFIQQCFVTNEPFFARKNGADVGALLIAQKGEYEPYRVLFSSPEYLAQNPETVRKFIRASIRGWVDYLSGDPAPGNALLMKLRPDLTPDLFAFSIQAMKDYQLVLGDPSRGERMGQLTPERIETQMKLLHELGVLEKPVKLGDVVSFDFLPDDVWPGGIRRQIHLN